MTDPAGDTGRTGRYSQSGTHSLAEKTSYLQADRSQLVLYDARASATPSLTWPGLPVPIPPPRPSAPESWCTRDSGRTLKSTLAACGMSVLFRFGPCDSLATRRNSQDKGRMSQPGRDQRELRRCYFFSIPSRLHSLATTRNKRRGGGWASSSAKDGYPNRCSNNMIQRQVLV